MGSAARQRSDLTVVEPPLPFFAGDGLERLLEVASELDITLLVDWSV